MSGKPRIRILYILPFLGLIPIDGVTAQEAQLTSSGLSFAAAVSSNRVRPLFPIWDVRGSFVAGQCTYPASGGIRLLAEIGTARWEESIHGGFFFRDPSVAPPSRREVYPSDSKGRVVELKVGPSAQVASVFGGDVFAAALVGVRWHHERWTYDISLSGWDSPRTLADRSGILLEARLGVEILSTGLTIQASYLTTHLSEPPDSWPPLSRLGGFRLGVALQLPPPTIKN
jgi:hypothetical protein